MNTIGPDEAKVVVKVNIFPHTMKPFIFVSIFAIFALRGTLSAKASAAIEKELRKALGISNLPTGSKDKIEIPDVLREQYYQQTGLSVNALSFRAVGANTAYANTVRSFPGLLVRVLKVS